MWAELQKMFEDTDILEPNDLGKSLGFFLKMFPIRCRTPLDVIWLLVDAIWH